MTKLVYIAGPYRSATPYGVLLNIQAAREVAARVWPIRGLAAVCPHTNTAHMEGLAPDDAFLEGTMEMMRRCDAVLLVGTWMDSDGARKEVIEANALGLPILYAWGDAGYCEDILRALARMPAGYRLPPGSQRPELDGGFGYWRG